MVEILAIARDAAIIVFLVILTLQLERIRKCHEEIECWTRDIRDTLSAMYEMMGYWNVK